MKLTFNKKKIIKTGAMMLSAIIIFGAGVWFGEAMKFVPAPPNLDFSLFWDAYNKIHQNYVGSSSIDNQQLTYGAINGMTQALGDPYTMFFDPEQAKMFSQDLAGSFSGIGVEVGMKNGVLTVIAPLKGTPGDKAGIKAGDQIVGIDGSSTSGMAIDKAVNLIRGQKGTQVTLSIMRQSWDKPKDFTITRDTIKVDDVTFESKPGGVAYVHILQFDESLPADFAKTAAQIQQAGDTKIVLDLRDDPGGYLDVCQQIAGWFLAPGQVVTTESYGQGSGKQPLVYKTSGNGQFSDYPMVVLINKGSASAAEILSGALHDDRGVKLVGEQSFGKGSVQEIFTLVDGKSQLKVTIAKWLTPKGNSIAEVGLTPDVPVQLTDQDAANNKDPQLDKALAIVQSLR